MSDQFSAILVLSVIYGLILVILAAIWISARRSRVPFVARPLSRQRSRMEQRLLLEAVSAVSRQRNPEAILARIAHETVEILAFDSCIVWLRQVSDRFVRAYAVLPDSVDAATLDDACENEELCRWVLFNAAPMPLDDTVRRMMGLSRGESWAAFASGLVVPFLDGDRMVGFMIAGGPRRARERRSEQFLTLFGAFAAILITRGQLDLKEQELRRRRQRSENLAAMGTMAAGLAHEIRNPLTFIRSASEHLQEHLPDAERELSGGILEEIDRINDRIEEMLSFGRLENESFAPVDLAKLIGETVKLVEPGAPGISFFMDMNLGEADFHGDGERLRRLFRNLIVNGIEAMQGEGHLRISSRADAGFVFIDIADSGGGIPADISDRIFEPFFTTKAQGTGMGLAISYGVAKAHGGLLELAYTSGKGTCFRVSLPINNR